MGVYACITPAFKPRDYYYHFNKLNDLVTEATWKSKANTDDTMNQTQM